MRSILRRVPALFLGMAVCNPFCNLHGQEARPALPGAAASDPMLSALPDAPEPQSLAGLDGPAAPAQSQQPSPGPAPATNNTSQSQDPQQPAAPNPSSPAPSTVPVPQTGTTPDSTTSQSPAPLPQPPPQSQHDRAEEQIKEQEHQRIAGILPSFNVTYRSDAASMTAAQKMKLAFRSAIDPYTFGIAFIVSGFSELQDEGTGFGWGPEGYFKRSGAAYLDAFDGAMIGNGILPAVLHQDPRYFRLGHGTFHHRLFYAIATSYICKHDNTGKWEPNYSNVGGNIIAGAISNLYYPSNTSGWGQTIDNGLIVTTEGTFGGVLQEFWPDISRKLFHKDPTHGLDAQARAADAAAKQKKQQEQDPKQQ
jgi:hypothetical protein